MSHAFLTDAASKAPAPAKSARRPASQHAAPPRASARLRRRTSLPAVDASPKAGTLSRVRGPRCMTALLECWHCPAFVVITAAVICATALGTTVAEDARTLLLASLVAVLGVPHGALDPLLARETGVWTDRPGLARYLTAYIALALAVLVAWKAAPTHSLVLFLALSAWHFGGDWADRLRVWRRLACGVGVVTLPILTHADEVTRLFALLVPAADAVVLTAWLGVVAPVALVAMLLTATAFRKVDPRMSAELLAVVALAVALEPVTYFTTYFCALHSPRHLLRSAPRLSGVAPSTKVLTTVALTLLTVGIGAGVLFAIEPTQLDAAVLRVVFIGLFALTVPHMLLGRAAAMVRDVQTYSLPKPAMLQRVVGLRCRS